MLLFAALLLPAVALGEAGDVTVRTDHPHYPGEGAFQTIDDCVAFATGGKTDPQERAIAMFNWLLTHQFHLHSPQEPYVPGVVPDTAVTRDDLTVYDANRGRFSYGYGLCGTVHAWNEPYWRAMKMTPRRRAFPGHVNSEIEYRGAWHAFDTDMAGLVFREDGGVAGYADIAENPGLVRQTNPPLPCYPFAWPSDLKVMQEGWREIAKGGDWYALYNGGYAAHPPIVHLRSGESFTRYFDPDVFGGPEKRRFWHHQKNGPFRNWTFVNEGTPRHEGADANSRGNAGYCNGVFVYDVPLKDDRWREDNELPVAAYGPAAGMVFHHFSPYVICGDPLDDANPMSARATDGLIIEGRAIREATISVSADGFDWSRAQDVRGTFRLDVTEHVKGQYGWRILIHGPSDGSCFDSLKFTTTVQVAQPIYPRLKPGGTTVTYRAADRGVSAVMPASQEEEGSFLVPHSKKNLEPAAKSAKQRFAWQTVERGPGEVVFAIESPRDLVQISGAFRYAISVPPPEESDFHIDVSTDGGETWWLLAKADTPPDNEFSSGWVYGKADVSDAATKTALVRCHLDNGGRPTGIIDAQLYGVYRTAEPQEMKLTYGWKEDGKSKTHAETIPAGTGEHKFSIDTGEGIIDEFVRIEAP